MGGRYSNIEYMVDTELPQKCGQYCRFPRRFTVSLLTKIRNGRAACITD